jgi:hypothetical protein
MLLSMTSTAALVELDGLILELGELRTRLAHPVAAQDEDALWELEVAFRHLSARARARADLLRRQIELLNEQRRSA